MSIQSDNSLRRIWEGHARLWQAFWLVGCIGFVLWTLVLYGGLRLLFGNALNPLAVLPLFLVPYVCAIIYVCVSVWRCAPNTDYPALTTLARVWTVVFAAGWLYRAVELVGAFSHP
jgi:hypothetical protein